MANTKAVVHPECGGSPTSSKHSSPTGGRSHQCHERMGGSSSGLYTLTLQPAAEGGSMERHPEESVSIVETLDEASPFSRSRDFSFLGGRHSVGSSALGLPGCGGDNMPGSRCNSSSSSANSNPFLAGPGTATRRKLYFNPAYFEPEMLQSPPPAALEFLHKLREVITMSKHKMAAKRFAPSLLGIPEEKDSVSSRTSQSVQGYTTTKHSWTGSQQQRRGSEPASPKQSCSLLPDADDVTGSKQQTIRRWLEDLESGDPVEEEQIETSTDDTSLTKLEEPSPPSSDGVTPPPKKLMDAVIKELVRERGLTPAEKLANENAAPQQNSNENNTKSIESIAEDNDYELISMQPTSSSSPNPTSPSSPIARPPLMMYCLPELLAKTNGYNLVSEVYVNDGYSSSNHSSASRHSTKQHRQRKPKGSVESSEPSSHSSSQSEHHEDNSPADDPETSNYPGSLTIKLSDAPSHLYRERRSDECEGFEPDTLDRVKRTREIKREDICADSLERPMKILLKSSGSFYTDAVMNENLNQPLWRTAKDIWQRVDLNERKKRSPSSISDLRSTNIAISNTLNKNSAFGSLREIFEAKRQQQLQKQIESLLSAPPQNNVHKPRGTTRSLIEPNELKWRLNGGGLNQQTIDDLRDLMWRSTPEAVHPAPRAPTTKPKRQRSADITSSPPTPPPPIPPSSNPSSSPPSLSSDPPSLPPKQKHKSTRQVPHPPLPPRDIKPPPSLPPKNLRGSRSPRILPNLVTSHTVPATGTSAGSDDDEDDEEDERQQEGSCTLGRKVENCLNDAFSTWNKHRNNTNWEPGVKISHRPGDSGYLSSDSNNSLKREAADDERKAESSETEESLCDGGSESGAESIGTDSFFFGRVRPQEQPPPPPTHVHQQVSNKTEMVPVLLHAGKKKPPPPPKRINSKLETKVLPQVNDAIINKIHSKYGL